MKTAIISATLAVITAFSTAALAGEWTTNWDTITGVESYGDEINVSGLDLAPNPAGCSNTTWAKVKSSLSTSEKERLALVLTSAFLGGREVKVKLDSSLCQGSYPVIYGVDMR